MAFAETQNPGRWSGFLLFPPDSDRGAKGSGTDYFSVATYFVRLDFWFEALFL